MDDRILKTLTLGSLFVSLQLTFKIQLRPEATQVFVPLGRDTIIHNNTWTNHHRTETDLQPPHTDTLYILSPEMTEFVWIRQLRLAMARDVSLHFDFFSKTSVNILMISDSDDRSTSCSWQWFYSFELCTINANHTTFNIYGSFFVENKRIWKWTFILRETNFSSQVYTVKLTFSLRLSLWLYF